jgi:hypothetical protein
MFASHDRMITQYDIMSMLFDMFFDRAE